MAQRSPLRVAIHAADGSLRGELSAPMCAAAPSADGERNPSTGAGFGTRFRRLVQAASGSVMIERDAAGSLAHS